MTEVASLGESRENDFCVLRRRFLVCQYVMDLVVVVLVGVSGYVEYAVLVSLRS